MGVLHVCDDAGAELPVGEPGMIYFERDEMPFQDWNDPEKTEAARHPIHREWTKLGDVGYVDADGFLYLTDRESFMIISGGVNIYPQEIEDCIIMHPKVADAAVFGVPNSDFGEEVKAVVQPASGDHGLRARSSGAVQGAQVGGFRGSTAQAGDRQAVQAPAERSLLGQQNQPNCLSKAAGIACGMEIRTALTPLQTTGSKCWNHSTSIPAN